MLAKLHSFSSLGIDAGSGEVDVDVSYSPSPRTILVGLPEAAVRESRHRVERAMVNSGFVRPQDRVVINLAPVDLPKDAAAVDLPIIAQADERDRKRGRLPHIEMVYFDMGDTTRGRQMAIDALRKSSLGSPERFGIPRRCED